MRNIFDTDLFRALASLVNLFFTFAVTVAETVAVLFSGTILVLFFFGIKMSGLIDPLSFKLAWGLTDAEASERLYMSLRGFQYNISNKTRRKPSAPVMRLAYLQSYVWVEKGKQPDIPGLLVPDKTLSLSDTELDSKLRSALSDTLYL